MQSIKVHKNWELDIAIYIYTSIKLVFIIHFNFVEKMDAEEFKQKFIQARSVSTCTWNVNFMLTNQEYDVLHILAYC